jgi:hypothetical protein
MARVGQDVELIDDRLRNLEPGHGVELDASRSMYSIRNFSARVRAIVSSVTMPHSTRT